MHSKQKTRSRKNSPTTKNTKQHNQPVQTNSKPEELTKQSVTNLNSVDITSSKHSESPTQTNQTTSRSLKEVIRVGLKSWQNWLNSLVGEGRELKKYWRIVEKIEALEPTIKKLTDEELKAKTKEFRSQLTGLNDKEAEKKLGELLPEAFAVVREAAVRTIGQRHFPVQLIGGMVLHDGRIAEMKTGEGKTLVATLTAYLNALRPEAQVHIVTVNDYLARRDASWMGQIYDFLGLTVGVIQNQASFYFKLGAQSSEADRKKRAMGLVDSLEDGSLDDERAVLDVENLVPCDRKRAYWIEETNSPVDIVYGVNSEFGFDYLRDNMAQSPDDIVQKAGHHVAIIDEVDSILIDEARTPLIISNSDQDSSGRYKQFAQLVKKLDPSVDYKVDEKRKVTTLTESGIHKVNQLLGVDNLYAKAENAILVHHLDLALRALTLFKKERDYVIRDGEVIIVDQNTGRLMFGRRYNQGLHQAIEAKENLEIKPESKTVASITFQNYFRLYKKLSGMTGTAATESEELYKIYKLFVVTIPTNKPVQRIDKPDKIFKTEAGKFKALVKDVAAIHATGQPILIGTTSIEKNLVLAEMLKQTGIPFNILNAKNHEQEARIIAEAGRKGAVTLATNIAGRGVDIKLGGEIPKEPEKFAEWYKEHEEVKQLGGLYVIGSERHESRRIDNQLRGRSGRQGDPGVSQFYVSLEDYILRVFGGDKVAYYASILPMEEEESIELGFLSKLIEQAQKKIEGFHYDIRKNVTDYDDVVNRQRQVIYSLRKSVLLDSHFPWEKEIQKVVYGTVFRALKTIQPNKQKGKLFIENLDEVSQELQDIIPLGDFDPEVMEVFIKDHKFKVPKIAKIYTEKIITKLKERWEIYQEKVQHALARYVFLRAIDTLWTEHLVTIDHLMDSVRLRAYAQKEPLVQFKEESMQIFINLLEEIERECAKTIFKVTPEMLPTNLFKEDK